MHSKNDNIRPVQTKDRDISPNLLLIVFNLPLDKTYYHNTKAVRLAIAL